MLNPSHPTLELSNEHTELQFDGSALLACSSGMRISVTGNSSDIARLSRTKNIDVYELPQANINSADRGLVIVGERTRWNIFLRNARTKYVTTTKHIREESDASIAILDWWDAFDDIQTLSRQSSNSIDWNDLIEWLGQRKAIRTDPRRALIVEIAEHVAPTLNERVQHLRRVLLRDHGMVPVHAIRQFDEQSIRWYVRQPGETLAEKAGSRQEVLAVVRHETFNTVENRVLKDFLTRCVHASKRYLRRFAHEFPNSRQVALVRRYARSCEEALSLPEFTAVQKPRPGVQANYVLQSDPRYRDIWQWYVKLLRNQDSEEEVWNWQCRLWSDVCRLIVGASSFTALSNNALPGLEPIALSQSSFKVGSTGRLGSRLEQSWAPGPRALVKRARVSGVLSLVDSRDASSHPIVQHCMDIGGHLYLVREALSNENTPPLVIVVWAINALASSSVFNARAAVDSASAGLSILQKRVTQTYGSPLKLRGLLLISDFGMEVSSDFVEYPATQGTPNVSVCTIGSDPRCWQDAVLEVGQLLESWL